MGKYGYEVRDVRGDRVCFGGYDGSPRSAWLSMSKALGASGLLGHVPDLDVVGVVEFDGMTCEVADRF